MTGLIGVQITGFIFYLVGTAFVVIGLVGSFFFDTHRRRRGVMKTDLTDDDKQMIRETMRMTADTIADLLEELARDPRMKKVTGAQALIAGSIAARNTSRKVWPWAS